MRNVRRLERLYVTDPETGRVYPIPAGGSDGSTDSQDGDADDGGTDADDDQFDEARAKAKIAKANSEAANLRKRLKEAEAKAAKLDELEDANKSEIERATEKVTAAEKRAQEAELRALRLEVAADKGLSPAQARRLVGSSKEDLEEDADDLIDTFGTSQEDKANGDDSDQNKEDRKARRPKEALKAGAAPDTEIPDVKPGMARLRAAYETADK